MRLENLLVMFVVNMLIFVCFMLCSVWFHELWKWCILFSLVFIMNVFLFKLVKNPEVR